MAGHTEMILRATRYIEENLGSELRLSEIAAAACFVIYCLLRDDGTDPAFFHRYLAASPPVFMTNGGLVEMEAARAATVGPLARTAFRRFGGLSHYSIEYVSYSEELPYVFSN